jgi:hypothetical protein
MEPNAVPGWLQILAAVGNAGVPAALAAVAAVLVWRQQRRRERRSEVAERAVVAVNQFCDELGRLWIEVSALVEASRARLDFDDVDRYVGELEKVRREWRDRNRAALRDLEVAQIQARTLLPDEWHWVRWAMMAYRFAENGIELHAAIVRREWVSDDAMKAIQPVLELRTDAEKIRRAVLDRLGPIARYEDPGALVKAWHRLRRDVDANFGRDLRAEEPKGPQKAD